MKFSVSGSNSGTISFTGKTIGSFRFMITSTAAITAASLKSSFFTVKTVRKNKVSGVNVSGNLWALANAFNPALGVGIDQDTTGDFQYGFEIPLPNVVILSGDDTMVMDLNISASVAGQITFCSAVPAIGNEVSFPVIRVETILKNQSQQPINAGDNVRQITLVNTSTDSAVNGMTIESPMITQQLGESDISAAVAAQWPVTPRHYSAVLFSSNNMFGDEYKSADGVVLNTTNDSGATSDGYIVIFGGVNDAGLYADAVRRAEKHDLNNLQKIAGSLG